MYVVEDLADILEESATIYEGDCSFEEKQLLEKLAEKSTFNIQQYFIEHASPKKNILVRAGAGTGKHIRWFQELLSSATNMKIQQSI